ncbi:MAG: cyclic nucleotide-binding domain-containing protein [Proteobacteria bacterium]|nr:cyclic nucleotide-binding domain-containing protein [Pseudomonadota bacterium]
MLEFSSVHPYLGHLAGALLFIGFAFKNQFVLRALAICGSLSYILFFTLASGDRIWQPIIWNSFSISANCVLIVLLLRDRHFKPASDEQMNLFRRWNTLSPGQFRRFMGLGTPGTSQKPLRLTAEGEALDRLYYVSDGKVVIEKGGRRFPAGPGIFIGELALLRNKPATASVWLEPGSRYLAWNVADVEKTMSKDPAMRAALQAILSADMAEKLAQA